MEDGLVRQVTSGKVRSKRSLNPCCSGRWSRTAETGARTVVMNTGLNPCCSGRWSRTWLQKATSSIQLLVLILVVVEDGLVRTHYNQMVSVVLS